MNLKTTKAGLIIPMLDHVFCDWDYIWLLNNIREPKSYD